LIVKEGRTDGSGVFALAELPDRMLAVSAFATGLASAGRDPATDHRLQPLLELGTLPALAESAPRSTPNSGRYDHAAAVLLTTAGQRTRQRSALRNWVPGAGRDRVGSSVHGIRVTLQRGWHLSGRRRSSARLSRQLAVSCAS